jgi:hypothetical protein
MDNPPLIIRAESNPETVATWDFFYDENPQPVEEIYPDYTDRAGKYHSAHDLRKSYVTQLTLLRSNEI